MNVIDTRNHPRATPAGYPAPPAPGGSSPTSIPAPGGSADCCPQPAEHPGLPREALGGVPVPGRAGPMQGGEGVSNLDGTGGPTLDDGGLAILEERARQLRDAIVARQSDAAPSTYTVRPGDTLGSIAERVGCTWQELYELNRDVIGPNPDLIQPGTELQLPDGAIGEMPIVPSSGEAPIVPSSGEALPVDEPVDSTPDAGVGAPTGVSQAQVDAARAQNAPTEGLVPQARRNLERANEYGLHLTGGLGYWNEWHADGSSVDVSNYDGRGFQETPEMRAYADEMVALGRSGATGEDGGLLVTHVVYAGMMAGASTGWEWAPVSQPGDITQGHWDHVHVETDSWV